MKSFDSLNDLLMEELAGLLNMENRLIDALPGMERAAESAVLKIILQKYLKMTREHAGRLRDIFNNAGQNPKEAASKAMEGFMAESQELVRKTEKSQDRDNAIIWLAQRMEQYEIAEYKKAREHAVDLGQEKIVESFTKTLNEQRALNFHLNELAQGMINAQTIGQP